MRLWIFSLCLLMASCGGGSSGGSGGGANSNANGACATQFMQRNTILIGGSMTDATATAAPFDARYFYLAGGVREAGVCATSCSAACGYWWGCWQDMTQPPGQYPIALLQKHAAATWQGVARPQLTMITYYELLNSAKTGEGAAEVAAINDAALLGRYLDDWRFLLQTLGNKQAMLHIEPDFWAYVRGVNSDPHLVPAQVTLANPTDCAAQENSAAGLARCMIAMTRKYAPNATVGLHASPWWAHMTGDGTVTGNFMKALGAADGDFIVTDPADRDAGYYNSIGVNSWWDDAAAANYLAWSKTLSDVTGKPTVMWQIPLGNMAQNNTANHWQDNRVDYLFAHLPDLARSGVYALFFGAGEGQQTTPETDGGNLVAKTTANWQAGGSSLCQ